MHGVDEMPGKDWFCGQCDFKNFARNLKCYQCDLDRPDDRGATWACPQCGENHRKDAFLKCPYETLTGRTKGPRGDGADRGGWQGSGQQGQNNSKNQGQWNNKNQGGGWKDGSNRGGGWNGSTPNSDNWGAKAPRENPWKRQQQDQSGPQGGGSKYQRNDGKQAAQVRYGSKTGHVKFTDFGPVVEDQRTA